MLFDLAQEGWITLAMTVPPLDLWNQHEPLLDQMLEAFEQIVRSSGFVLGKTVEDFENALGQACGGGHVTGVSSGTDSLLVALMAMGIGHGDEVITSPFTFFATAGSIARVGATPVFVDVDDATFNIDVAKIEVAITGQTRGIMPVHLYGHMADMDGIMTIARKHNLKVIEDAAQAIGAKVDDRQAGTIGDVGCFSFYPTKNLAALGDAGACLSRDDVLAKAIHSMRLHGETSRYHHRLIGGNFRIDAIQAAMLQIKLPYLAAWTEKRRALAQRYTQLLQPVAVMTPTQLPGYTHVYHQYTLRVLDGGRDALRDHLVSKGIGHGVFYPVPLHLQECFAHLGGKAGQFPVAERQASEVISLPIFPGMTQQQQDQVIHAIQDFFS
jgi:dTDP-4-amino-4,6-dideoxygalactose transaminase